MPRRRTRRPSRTVPWGDVAALTPDAFAAWDAETEEAAWRAYATFKLILTLKLQAVGDDIRPFCQRTVCRRAAACRGEDFRPVWEGAENGAPPHAPPCLYEALLDAAEGRGNALVSTGGAIS